MSARKYVLTVAVGDALKVDFWDSRKPQKIGMTMPWTIMDSPTGIRIKHQSGKFCEIKPALIKSGTPIRIPSIGEDASTQALLKVVEINTPEPAYDSPVLPGPSSWMVFEVTGREIQDVKRFSGSYSAKINKRSVFTLIERNSRFEFKFANDPIEVWVKGKRVSLEDRTATTLSKEDLANTEIRVGVRAWRFRSVSTEAFGHIDRPVHVLNSDTIWFRRSFIAAAILFLILMVGLSIIYNRQAEEEKKKEPPQFAKIVLSRPPPSRGGSMPVPENPIPSLVQTDVPSEVSQSPSPDRSKGIPAKGDAPKPGVALGNKVGKTTPPKVSSAVLEAKKLQNSLKGLVGITSLMAKSSVPPAPQGNAASNILTGKTGNSPGGSVPSVNALGAQNVRVGYADTGAGGIANGTSYGGQLQGNLKGSAGGQFLSTAIGNGVPTLSDEGLTREEVKRVILDHQSEIRYCYETFLLKKPGGVGKIVMGWTIAQGGQVKGLAVKDSSMQDPTIDKCVMSRLVTWKFPKPKGNTDVHVTYPFNFSPVQ